MQLLTGFAETDITPIEFPVRTYMNKVDTFLDPIYAHIAVFKNQSTCLVLISLDIVIIEWQYVDTIRKAISSRHGIAGCNIMVCATHNHACPAVIERATFNKEERYIAFMIERTIESVDDAFAALKPVSIGIGSGFEGRISFNRRYIKRDGTVISQPSIDTVRDDILCNEGVVDPEIGVVALRDSQGQIRGVLVNFACHACHLLGQLSAGYPGILYNRVKQTYGQQCVCLFLNGPCGNIIHRNYSDPAQKDTKERTGNILADSVESVIGAMEFREDDNLAMLERTLPLKYRPLADCEKALRNLDQYNVFSFLKEQGWYDYSFKKLQALHAEQDHENAIVQVLRLGEAVFGTVPAEYFAQYSLQIKAQSDIRKTFVISLANGWLGYVPDKGAYRRQGGHESTPAIWSKMDENAGTAMTEAILAMIGEIEKDQAPPPS